ncbi:MAG: serine protease [Patescibacteria group bacterium]|mgnify:CR=1 FL=1
MRKFAGLKGRTLLAALVISSAAIVGCFYPHFISRFLPKGPQAGLYVAHEGAPCKKGIDAEKSGGNAYVVGPNLVMTVAHLVWEQGKSMTAVELVKKNLTLRRGGLCVNAAIIAVDRPRDIMFLAAFVEDDPIQISDETPLPGQIVTSRGFEYIEPGIVNWRFLVHSGVVKNVTAKLCKDGRTLTNFEIHERKPSEGIFRGGTSGSAFFDSEGRIVGMLTRSNRVTFAVAVGGRSLKEVLNASFDCLTIPCIIANPCTGGD